MRASAATLAEALEERAAKWKAEHLPLSDVSGFLFALLEAVQQEAGQDAFQRVAGRVVSEKARKVDTLARGARS